MFLVDIEKQEFGLKPMNCPGALLHALDTCCTLAHVFCI